MLIIHKNRRILFDASPDIEEQLNKVKEMPTEIFITSICPSKTYGLLRLSPKIPIHISKIGVTAFKEIFKGAKSLPFNLKPIEPTKGIDLDGLEIIPYRIESNIDTLGYRLELEKSSITYAPVIDSIKDRRLLLRVGIGILDGSSRNKTEGHMGMLDELKLAKAWRVHTAYFTNIGHSEDMLHSELLEYSRKIYNRANILYDGQTFTIGEESSKEEMFKELEEYKDVM